MKPKVILMVLLWVTIASISHSSETVTIKGTGTTSEGNPLMLTGKLKKPAGEGPFPAVICLHGCGGISKRDHTWAERLSSWGYVTLQVDSFKPRGQTNICTHPKLIPPEVRAQDAHDGKRFLSELSFVNSEKIGVMGWSHGGSTTLYAVNPKIPIENKGLPFRVAIAFYPFCDLPLTGLDAPLLILSGSYDDWTPPEKCSQMMPSKKSFPEVVLKIYPKAYHGFDSEGVDRYVQGSRSTHRVLYNPSAAEDAIIRVKDFLEKYLK